MNDLTQSGVWAALHALARQEQDIQLRERFAADPHRFAAFSLRHDGLLIDYSKQRVSREVMDALHALWQVAHVPNRLASLRAGDPINHTEGRAVLHTALRHRGTEAVTVDGHDVMPDVRRVLAEMAVFCADIHQGRWKGATGAAIRTVVNIGIGGSDLGPRMAEQALAALRVPDLTVRFVANLDAADLATTLQQCDPATTLFIVASKTFSTQETMQNAHSARRWLVGHLGEAAVARHFVAVSTNLPAVAAFGIDPENTFEFWDWVGGRFSLWSAIGLPLALSVGMENFDALLAGAYAMDQHFFATPVAQNLPATLALLEIWNTNFLGAQTRAVLPYSQSLGLLPRYLQQLEMESNGKQVDRDGKPLHCASAPVVWGEPGTNGQHAFYQQIHQGGRLLPCEFIAVVAPDFALPDHHDKLLSHCFAQSEALMRGKTLDEARAELHGAVLPAPTSHGALDLAPYKVFPGNQPSTTLLLPVLTPYVLGQLIAMYEHKVFVLGALWNLNSFDQWGVEYGKQLASRLLPMLEGKAEVSGVDSSTAGLINYVRGQ